MAQRGEFPHFYDRLGNPISIERFGRLTQADFDYRRVALDYVGPFVVSTVWLGVDHGWGHGSAPLIFETMVFTADGWERLGMADMLGRDCERYSTEEQALRGHEEMVTLVRATVPDIPDYVPDESGDHTHTHKEI